MFRLLVVLIQVLLYLLVISVVSTSQSIYKDCPRGFYREEFGDVACQPCPRGTYGNTSGLTSSFCSGFCPKGRYRDTLGGRTEDDCTFCPEGFIGSRIGMTSSRCAGACPVGRYSSEKGITSSKSCLACPPGYYGSQCYKANE